MPLCHTYLPPVALGKTAQTEMVLFVSHLPMWPFQVGWAYLWHDATDGFADTPCQWKDSSRLYSQASEDMSIGYKEKW